MYGPILMSLVGDTALTIPSTKLIESLKPGGFQTHRRLQKNLQFEIESMPLKLRQVRFVNLFWYGHAVRTLKL